MDKKEITNFIELGYSIAGLSKHFKKSKSTVCYWLEKYGLKTNPSLKQSTWRHTGLKVCPRCEQEKGLDLFYRRRDGEEPSVYCKVCSGNQVKERQRALKAKAIEYKGGSCKICGYNKCPASLEFHHANPSEKDFELSNFNKIKIESAKKELDKCVLLCSNCHKEVHFYNTDVTHLI